VSSFPSSFPAVTATNAFFLQQQLDQAENNVRNLHDSKQELLEEVARLREENSSLRALFVQTPLRDPNTEEVFYVIPWATSKGGITTEIKRKEGDPLVTILTVNRRAPTREELSKTPKFGGDVLFFRNQLSSNEFLLMPKTFCSSFVCMT